MIAAEAETVIAGEVAGWWLGGGNWSRGWVRSLSVDATLLQRTAV